MASTRPPVSIIPAYEPRGQMVTVVQRLLAEPDQEVILVDDGSSPACRPVFDELAAHPRVHVIRHAANLGKGQALKTAFNYFLINWSDDAIGVVTADADGQHLVDDIRRVARSFESRPDALCLGARSLRGNVPWKSAFGNTLTRHIFRGVIGKRLHDTQTGLRAIPRALLAHLMRIPATGYEFELEMLVLAARERIPIVEVPITTVYEDNNRATHFNPVRDSLKIYFVFLRFVALSLSTTALDFAVFAIAYAVSHNILLSTVLARLVAGTFNFTLARLLVFRSTASARVELAKYVVLVVWLMAVSYSLLTVLVIFAGLPVFLAKGLAETALFFSSFALQRLLVFSRGSAVRA